MIDVRDLTVRIDDVALLPETSVAVPAGETLVVRGRNGAGKSTFLRALAGMQEPTAGTVRIDDRPVSRRDRSFRRRVAALIGLPPMATDLTVADHARMVAATWYDDRAESEQRAVAALADLDLEPLGRRYPHELSTGQQQLVALALVLVRPCDVLLLDEPEQRLDPDRLETVGEVLARRRDAGTTLVVVTHSAVLADRIADRTLDLGRR